MTTQNGLFNERDADCGLPCEDIASSLAAAWQANRLPSEPGSGRGRRHGTSSSQPFDRWFRYPAGFASDYATLLLGYLDVPAGGVIVDCFAGSGVIGTAARTQGMRFRGIEAHPLIAELAALKLRHPPDSVVSLDQTAAEVATVASELAAAHLARDELAGPAQPDLVRRCFIGWPYQRPAKERQPRCGDPVDRFRHRAHIIAEDLAAMPSAAAETVSDLGRVVVGDARQRATWNALGEGPADGCVSSPPYLNNFDYADATRLELYFWGEVTSWAQMCSTVRAGMVTATTQQSTVGATQRALSALDQFGSTGVRIADLTDQLKAERQARDRGKEYDRVVPDYFAGIAQVLANLADALRPGAPCAWLVGDSAPYGVHIDTPELIGELAVHLGFRVEADILLRHRGRRWTTAGTRHQVELSERLLLFRRTARPARRELSTKRTVSPTSPTATGGSPRRRP